VSVVRRHHNAKNAQYDFQSLPLFIKFVASAIIMDPIEKLVTQ